MTSIRDVLLETAQNYMNGLNDPGPDAAGVIAHRTADCVQRIIPKNLNQPQQTNEQYHAFMKQGGAFIKSLKFAYAEGYEPIVDEKARKVLLHILSDGESIFGSYNNEYFIVLTMTEDGTKIKDVLEFLDTQVFTGFISAVQKVVNEGQKQG